MDITERLIEKREKIYEYEIKPSGQIVTRTPAMEVWEVSGYSKPLYIAYMIDKGKRRKYHYTDDFWDITQAVRTFRFVTTDDQMNRKRLAAELSRRATIIKLKATDLLRRADRMSDLSIIVQREFDETDEGESSGV